MPARSRYGRVCEIRPSWPAKSAASSAWLAALLRVGGQPPSVPTPMAEGGAKQAEAAPGDEAAPDGAALADAGRPASLPNVSNF